MFINIIRDFVHTLQLINWTTDDSSFVLNNCSRQIMQMLSDLPDSSSLGELLERMLPNEISLDKFQFMWAFKRSKNILWLKTVKTKSHNFRLFCELKIEFFKKMFYYGSHAKLSKYYLCIMLKAFLGSKTFIFEDIQGIALINLFCCLLIC